MNSRQAKISVETMREVANDKTLRTKGDKDRRLKEKKQNNTKKFTDERRFAQKKNDREIEKLKAKHDKEMENLVKDVQNVSTLHKNTNSFYKADESCLFYRKINRMTKSEQTRKAYFPVLDFALQISFFLNVIFRRCTFINQ